MHRSKKYATSITSSATVSTFAPSSRPSAFATLEIEHKFKF